MRIVFAGTPEVALPTLENLIASSHEVIAVITRPPSRVGRGRGLHPSPVAEYAARAGISLIETSHMKAPEFAHHMRELHPDLGVVVAYGGLVPSEVLQIPRFGWINLHFSDLPRWRGAAPVQWAIRSGDTMTASCVFQLETGLDTGPVFSRQYMPIRGENTGELLEKMSFTGAQQVCDVVDSLEAGTAIATPQSSEGITKARMLTHEDGYVDFADTAARIDQCIRSVTPNPGAWTVLPDGRRMKIAAVTLTDIPSPGVGIVRATKNTLEVGCTDTCLRIDTVAPAGKGWMDGAAWARGARPEADFRLGEAR
ncbi:methionyl-tRNA formyltransferase [Schaalia sp. lx-260]|uniref:methionyl-tRNA formyltransferase n=1 Tax=Schaalia sp. lx-260 TaxID=2899082 RepID=UPI001E52F0F2|nr:methionyl-tRNA formyltransferase [Schaalia sp. lx-260]